MWQYKNYSDELYHHKYIERISVPGGYKYVYPSDKTGSGTKPAVSGKKPVMPGSGIKPAVSGKKSLMPGSTITNKPALNIGAKGKTSRAFSTNPAKRFIEKAGDKLEKTLGEAKDDLRDLGDQVKDAIDSALNDAKIKVWAKKNKTPSDLYGKNLKSDKKDNVPPSLSGKNAKSDRKR